MIKKYLVKFNNCIIKYWKKIHGIFPYFEKHVHMITWIHYTFQQSHSTKSAKLVRNFQNCRQHLMFTRITHNNQ